ncbi:MAG: MBL fold metallo-hydrolase [Clostridia bacterium]|nr:MBL fold metallo-hydrolase [Clostridia bacterium]
MKNKALVIFLSIIMFCVGAVAGVAGLTYINLPHHEELVKTNSVFYSMSDKDDTVSIATGVQQPEAGAVSVHFLELGNKYTGDCTYIKVGENIDILIDCGSKSTSVATVSKYLNQYVTDGTLEYVIVTHAHQDHYAGFATTTKVDSIFDLYECETIITFSTTNQKMPTEYLKQTKSSTEHVSKLGITSYSSTTTSTSTLYANFNRELTAELSTTLTKGNKAGQKPTHLLASDIVSDYTNGEIILDETNDISLQILDNYYYYTEGHENNYSVCTMINQGDKHFIFTGDLESDGEKELIKTSRNAIFGTADFTSRDYGVELYKAGHHGSKTSSSMDLLNVIKPRIVCVCCCAGSSEYTDTAKNQFPTKQFINNVSQFTDKVYVTTLCVDYDKDLFTAFNGNIVVMAKKEDVEVSVYCSNNTLVLRETEWFKNNRLEMCKQVEEGVQILNPTWYN